MQQNGAQHQDKNFVPIDVPSPGELFSNFFTVLKFRSVYSMYSHSIFLNVWCFFSDFLSFGFMNDVILVKLYFLRICKWAPYQDLGITKKQKTTNIFHGADKKLSSLVLKQILQNYKNPTHLLVSAVHLAKFIKENNLLLKDVWRLCEVNCVSPFLYNVEGDYSFNKFYSNFNVGIFKKNFTEIYKTYIFSDVLIFLRFNKFKESFYSIIN